MSIVPHLKEKTAGLPIRPLPIPKKVVLPLSQHVGRPLSSLVKPGQELTVGQLVATAPTGVFANLHASITGKVTGIGNYPHPFLGKFQAIVIEGEGGALPQEQSEAVPRPWPEVRDPQGFFTKLSAEEIRNRVFAAGIVGLGGAAFPAHLKLAPPNPVDSFILNGSECEPYLTADHRLMVEKPREILLGMELIIKALGEPKGCVAIEDNKPDAISAMEGLIKDFGYTLKVLPSRYPQGGEKQLIQSVLGREVPRGKLPFAVATVVHNVATAFAIYEAIYQGKPLYERVVTVTGAILANPGNFLVRIGTSLRELIEAAGPLREEPHKVIAGGPMMGVAQFSLDAPVVKGTSGVLLLGADEKRIVQTSCIRCGACIRSCPVGLMPCMINLVVEKNMTEQTKAYGALDCIECGLCSFHCPARIPLVQSIRLGKRILAQP